MKHTASTALLAGVLTLSFVGGASGFATAELEALEAAPVDTLRAVPDADLQAPAPKSESAASDGAEAPAESVPYDFARPRLLLPYYLTAYIPPVDRTELNLGLFLSQSPGIDVSLGWGALDRLMISTRVSAMGASSTVGLNLKYLALPESPSSTKPAVTVRVQGLFLNHRTLGEVRENIFRGNRIQIGAVLSKDLGSLARNLQAGRAVQDLLSPLRLHAEALVEYRNGRYGAAEDALSDVAVGAKAALEAVIQPDVIYAFLVLDTLPDWLDEENYYAGVRYYSQPDLAFDILGGRIQNSSGMLVVLSWIF